MTGGPSSRTELLVGAEGVRRLATARVIVVGLGGVGSHATEALVRAGVGWLKCVDFDRVQATDLNRQVHATSLTLGRPKVEAVAERCREIHPAGVVEALDLRYRADTRDTILGGEPHWVLDCIDVLTEKADLLATCVERGIPVISAMGAGGRLDPTRVRVSDLGRSRIDPVARVVRDLLRKRGVESGVLAVWSDEPPRQLHGSPDLLRGPSGHLVAQGSVSWVPAVFGATMAGVVLSLLLGQEPWGLDRLPGRGWVRTSAATGKPSRKRRKELLERAGHGRPERDPRGER